MAKKDTFQDLVLGPIKNNQDMWRWLYVELRSAIVDGRLKPGARLPSTRSLAVQYGVSRGTVVTAFKQLRDEGYTSSTVGAGTFVNAEAIGVQGLESRRSKIRGPSLSRATSAKRARTHLDPSTMLLPTSHHVGKAFRSWEPAIDLFPVSLWSKMAGQVYRKAPRALYGQGDAKGFQPLRRAIAEYVGRSRGVRCSADQIVVTTGAQQALDILSRLLLDPGDEVWMEDPGYPGASHALRAAGAKLM
jgi:GntR family transcriptional regulator/MocR family aminotransferase